MKASDIGLGDEIGGWIVTDVVVYNYHGKCPSGRPGALIEYVDDPLFVLLTLEGTYYLDGHDVNGEEIWYLGPPPEGQPTKTETRRTWLRADENTETKGLML